MRRVWASSDFARHYFRNRGFFLFLQVLRWFTSLGSLTPAYVFSRVYLRFTQVGFPIRTSPDISPVCGSPRLFAACHVLHRLILPRHPPCALSSLTIELTLAQQSDLHLRYRVRKLKQLVSDSPAFGMLPLRVARPFANYPKDTQLNTPSPRS